MFLAHFTNVSLQVGEMKKELVDLQPKLKQAKIDNNKMMKVNRFYIFFSIGLEHTYQYM